MIASASAMIRSISSLHVGMSWMSPATMPQLQAPASSSPILQDAATSRTADEVTNVLDRRGGALVALDGEDFLDRRIAQYPLGIAQWPHDQARLQFIRRNQRLLDIVMRRRLLRGNEPRAHVDAVGPEGESGDQTARIGHAAGSHERDLQLLGNPGQQDHVGDVVFARMAAALKPVDTDRIAADPLGSQRVTHRGAFVDDLDPVRLQGRDVLCWIAARGFDNPRMYSG